VLVEGNSATAEVIRKEMAAALSSLLGQSIPVMQSSTAGIDEGTVVIGTPTNSPAIRQISIAADLTKIGKEGFLIRPARTRNRTAIAVVAEGEMGALYGAYHFLRLLQTGQPIDRLDVFERPRVQLRMLNHWDNANGTIERGYAGNSLWQWADLPGKISSRYLWRKAVPFREFFLSCDCRWNEDCGPARQRRDRMVEGEGRGDL
jgi:alpha-glucuronidase